MDYRHHWHDVLAGSILGIVTAYFSYRQYYPPLQSEMSHQPYPPRVKRGGQILPTHARDESDTSALADLSLSTGGTRTRTERRYSDRPSMGDEEVALDIPPRLPSTSGTNGANVGKDSWQEEYHGSL